MDDALLVRRLERLPDLPGDRQSLVDRHRPLRQPFRERLPFDELEHESFDTAGFHEPVDRADVRMVERREKLGFPLEPRQPLGVLRDRLGEDFDREVPVQLGIPGPVDLAHPSRSERRQDFVGTELRSGSERHLAYVAARIVSRPKGGRRFAPRERSAARESGSRSSPFGRAASRCARRAQTTE